MPQPFRYLFAFAAAFTLVVFTPGLTLASPLGDPLPRGASLRVLDGRSLVLAVGGRNPQPRVVVLAGVDAPELAQPGGVAAYQALAELVDAIPIAQLRVLVAGRVGNPLPVGLFQPRFDGEQYQVLLPEVHLRWVGHADATGLARNDGDFARHLVREGWAYPATCVSGHRYFDAMVAARSAHRGLWAVPELGGLAPRHAAYTSTEYGQFPWDWRKLFWEERLTAASFRNPQAVAGGGFELPAAISVSDGVGPGPFRQLGLDVDLPAALPGLLTEPFGERLRD